MRTGRLAWAILAAMLGCSWEPHGAAGPAAVPPLATVPAPVAAMPPWDWDGGGLKATASIPVPLTDAWRLLAFPAEEGGFTTLFLWDEWLGELYLLNGALAGLIPVVDGSLRPRVFGKGKKLLFTVGDRSFFWDMELEERTTPVTDGRSALAGGPQTVVTPDGKWLAYVSNRDTVVLKRADGRYIAKTIELTKPAAEGPLLDVDMTVDGTVLILNLGGRLFLYDVVGKRLALVAPLDAEAFDGKDGLREVAISPTGLAYASTARGGRVLLWDAERRAIDVLAGVNLALGRIVDLYFVSEDLLILETVGVEGRLWCYDRRTGLLRLLVALTDPLGP